MARTKENLANLQTLLQELNLIEEKNQTLETELERRNNEIKALQEQIELKDQALSKVSNNNVSVRRYSVNLMKESGSVIDSTQTKEKLHNISQLANQIVQIASSVKVATSVLSPSSTQLQLLQEREAHESTKQILEDEIRKGRESMAKAHQLELRLKKLMRVHSQAQLFDSELGSSLISVDKPDNVETPVDIKPAGTLPKDSLEIKVRI
jgi:hypothetical protein